jgi:hypothetical protein
MTLHKYMGSLPAEQMKYPEKRKEQSSSTTSSGKNDAHHRTHPIAIIITGITSAQDSQSVVLENSPYKHRGA